MTAAIQRRTFYLFIGFALACLMLSPAPGRAASLQAGIFLRAVEGMPDLRFRQSVILLLRHDVNGSIGLIINRPSPMRLDQLFSRLPQSIAGDSPLYYGGPVNPEWIGVLFSGQAMPGVALHILPGIKHASLEQLLGDRQFVADAGKVRVFSGVASWAPGQLEREMMQGDWHTVSATAADVFDHDPGRLWKRMAPGTRILI